MKIYLFIVLVLCLLQSLEFTYTKRKQGQLTKDKIPTLLGYLIGVLFWGFAFYDLYKL